MSTSGQTTVSSFRRHVRAGVLAELRAGGPATRAELMERLGLSRTALTRVLTGLLEDSLLEEEPSSGPRSAGRPARRLSARRPPRQTLAVHVTSSELAVAAVDENGSVLQEVRHALSLDEGLSEVIEAIRALRPRLATGHEALPSRLVVVVPTMVSADGGSVHPDGARALMPTWIHPDLATKLKRAVGLPALLQNDGRLAALAEARIGAARGFRDVLYIAPGANGIAAGLVLDGRLHTGAGSAGELSHIVARIGGCSCPCGQRGCLAAEVREVVRRLRRVSDVERRDSDEIGVPADAPGAGAALEEIVTMIARVIGGTVSLVHPEAVVISDRLTSDPRGSLYPLLTAAIPLYAHPAMTTSMSMLQSSLGPTAALAGAGLFDSAADRITAAPLPR